jgi:hypothetical protein
MDLSSIAVVVLALILAGLLLRLATRRRSLIGLEQRPEERALLDQAGRLWKSDPAAATQMLDSYYKRDGEREDAERAKLREAAKADRSAAQELQRRLNVDLEVWQQLLTNARRKSKKDMTAQRAVANLEQWDSETRAELARLERHIRQLKT